MTRRRILWACLAVLGVLITAAITWGTSRLAGQRIGLASEPLSVVSSLAPPLPAPGPNRTPVVRHAPGRSAHRRTPSPQAGPSATAAGAAAPSFQPPVTGAGGGSSPAASSTGAGAGGGGAPHLATVPSIVVTVTPAAPSTAGAGSRPSRGSSGSGSGEDNGGGSSGSSPAGGSSQHDD